MQWSSRPPHFGDGAGPRRGGQLRRQATARDGNGDGGGRRGRPYRPATHSYLRITRSNHRSTVLYAVHDVRRGDSTNNRTTKDELMGGFFAFWSAWAATVLKGGRGRRCGGRACRPRRADTNHLRETQPRWLRKGWMCAGCEQFYAVHGGVCGSTGRGGVEQACAAAAEAARSASMTDEEAAKAIGRSGSTPTPNRLPGEVAATSTRSLERRSQTSKAAPGTRRRRCG